jgi:hypothetical protein
VSTTPANYFSAVSLTPAINFRLFVFFLNDINDLFKGVNNTSDKFFAGVVVTAEQLITGVVDTGDNINSRISQRIFAKNSKRLQWNTW